jgi:hypothetical protein
VNQAVKKKKTLDADFSAPFHDRFHKLGKKHANFSPSTHALDRGKPFIPQLPPIWAHAALQRTVAVVFGALTRPWNDAGRQQIFQSFVTNAGNDLRWCRWCNAALRCYKH